MKFFEDIFPFSDLSIHSKDQPPTLHDLPNYFEPLENASNDSSSTQPIPVDESTSVSEPISTTNPIVNLEPVLNLIPNSPSVTSVPPSNTKPQMGRGHREKFPSVLLQDFVTHTKVVKCPSRPCSSPSATSCIFLSYFSSYNL